MLITGDIAFTNLIDENVDEVVQALDCPQVARYLCFGAVTDVRWAVCRRWRSDLSGDSITLVLRRRGRVIGWTGVLRIDALPFDVQSSTFLHPDAWGGEANVRAKHVLWAMTRLLGRDRLLFSIDPDNPRSQAALWKLFPDATVVWLAAPGERGADMVLSTTRGPNRPDALDHAQVAALRTLLERHPAWRVLRRDPQPRTA